MLSEHRDMAAAQAFFRSAKSATGQVPDQVTTDGHGAYPRAIRSTLGRRVAHRTSAYKNNRVEQDHRGIKGHIRGMRGFQSFDAARRFCRSYDELRNFLRSRTCHNLRWSPFVGQFDGLDKLGPWIYQAANLVICSAPYASLGACPAGALCGRSPL